MLTFQQVVIRHLLSTDIGTADHTTGSAQRDHLVPSTCYSPFPPLASQGFCGCCDDMIRIVAGFFFLSFWLFDSAFETFRISCQFFHIGPFRFGFAWKSNVMFGFNKKAALCKLTRLFKWRKRVKYFSKTDTTLL